MDAKGCVVAFLVLGILAIVVGIPASYVFGVFLSKIALPGLVLLGMAGAVIAAVVWLSGEDSG